MRPEMPAGRDLFLAVAALVIVGTAQLTDPGTAAELTGLVPAVLACIALMARGATNTEIAETLILGLATVKTHVGSIFTKLMVRDRAAAIVFAYDHGLVGPRPAE